ncbi:hypothetical protein [Micromonospora aurantiaca (nom. illeg.)]|uniref:hypothetical protein n=1 Tax=Micromonospora aurantiaca (nom. illeg.) TaxID=47850 RepID=UPI0033E9AEFF
MVALSRLDASHHTATALDREVSMLSQGERERLSTLASMEAERRAYLADARARRLGEDEDVDADLPGLARSLATDIAGHLTNPYFYIALTAGVLATVGSISFLDLRWPFGLMAGLAALFFFRAVVLPGSPLSRSEQEREDSEAEHDLAHEQICDLLDELSRTADSGQRADLLDQIADTQYTLASAARVAWPEHEADATAEITAGLLYRTLGAVERSVATGEPLIVPTWFDYAEPVLQRMAATSDLDGRMALLDKLHAVFYARPGRHATVLEVIETLPAPGRFAGDPDDLPG